MFGPDFYPTPRNIAHLMLQKISKDARHFLEPSAGRGDLAQAICEWQGGDDRYSRGYGRKVDCIEYDPNLCAILREKGFPVVGHDWLTYPGVSYYDAIVMNPPFSSGDDHLLRAWDFLYNGEIVCLLNEETIKNPYTESRQRLAGIIREHGGVDYLGPVFKAADRKTLVSVALVYLRKVSEDDRADLWAKTTGEEKPVNADIGASAEECMVAIRDTLGNMEHYYNAANTHMLKAFEHLRKAAIYMGANGIEYLSDYEKMPHIAFQNVNNARAEFGRKHRHDAWYQVFKKMQFHRWLDKKQTEAFLRDIETHGNIPFTADNIKGTLENVFSQRKRLFEQSVANVFDELTSHYKGNTTGSGGSGDGRSGWKSNESYKVNEKLVFPYGCSYDPKFGGHWDLWRGSGGDIDVYNDLDRILCVLDGKNFEETWTVGRVLNNRFRDFNQRPGTWHPGGCLESEFFRIRFYKKGTVHLWFKDRRLWEEFNKTAAAGKRWLGQDTKGTPGQPRRPETDPAESGGEPRRQMLLLGSMDGFDFEQVSPAEEV